MTDQVIRLIVKEMRALMMTEQFCRDGYFSWAMISMQRTSICREMLRIVDHPIANSHLRRTTVRYTQAMIDTSTGLLRRSQ